MPTLYADDGSGIAVWQTYTNWSTSPTVRNQNPPSGVYPGVVGYDDAVFYCTDPAITRGTSAYEFSSDISLTSITINTEYGLTFRSTSNTTRFLEPDTISMNGTNGKLYIGDNVGSTPDKLLLGTSTINIGAGTEVFIKNGLYNINPVTGEKLDIAINSSAVGPFLPTLYIESSASATNAYLVLYGGSITVSNDGGYGYGNFRIYGGRSSTPAPNTLQNLSSVVIDGGVMEFRFVVSPPAAYYRDDLFFNITGTNPIELSGIVGNIQLSGNTTLSGTSLSGVITNGYFQRINTGNYRLTLDGGTKLFALNILSPVTFGSGGITTIGANMTLYLQSTMTGAGTMIVSSGKFRVGSTGSVSTAVQLDAGSTFLFDTTETPFEIPAAVTGTGAISGGRSKFYNLSGFSGSIAQTYTEFTGSCQLNAGTYSGALSSGADGILWDSSSDQTFGGTITGAGTFLKRQPSTVTITGAIDGATDIEAGTVVVEAAGRLGAGADIVRSGATLAVKSGGSLGTSGGVTVIGTLKTGGALTVSGSLTLAGGVYSIGGA